MTSGWREGSLAGRFALALGLALVAACISAASAGAVTFNWSSALSVDPGTSVAVTCPSSSQCTVVDAHGQERTFDPATRTLTPAHVVASGAGLDSVSCPSTTQCTAIGYAPSAGHGQSEEVTFNPTTGTVNAAGVQAVTPPFLATGLSCPTTTQCTTMNERGSEVTFNPQSGAELKTAGISSDIEFAVSCPSTTECMAIADDSGPAAGTARTFNPLTGGDYPHGDFYEYNGNPNVEDLLDAVSCGSVSQCTIVDANGNEITDDPLTSAPKRVDIDGHTALTSVSCPSGSQCTAVDQAGGTVTFNPTAPASASRSSVAGKPHLVSVSCPTTSLCVAGDQAGNVYVATPAPPPPLVATTSAPGKRTRTSAVIRGAITTNGNPVVWQFQYGRSRNYDRGTPLRSIPAGASRPVAVSWKLLHLAPNALLHYRLVALISQGAGRPPLVSYGRDRTVRTLATGKLVLSIGRLRVTRRYGFTFVPLRCVSRAACVLHFAMTTTVRAGSRTNALYCLAGSERIRAGPTRQAKVYIDGRCLARLRSLRSHRVAGRFVAQTSSGQRGIARNLTLSF